MEALNESIAEIKDALSFHRKRARAYLIMLWVIAFLLFLGGLLFGGYILQVLQTLAVAVVQGPVAPNNPVKAPDLVKIATENNLGYIMLSGFTLTLFTIVGLMRHHVKRIVLAEDRLFYLRKIRALYNTESGFHPDAVKSLAAVKESQSSGLVVNPGYDLIEKSIQALSKNIDTLVKKLTK